MVNGSVFLHKDSLKERRITSIGSMCLKLTRTRLHSTKICNIFIGTKKTPWCPWTLFIHWILKLKVVQIHSTQQSWLKITCRLGWWHFCDCHKMRMYFDANLLHYCDVLVLLQNINIWPHSSPICYTVAKHPEWNIDDIENCGGSPGFLARHSSPLPPPLQSPASPLPFSSQLQAAAAAGASSAAASS